MLYPLVKLVRAVILFLIFQGTTVLFPQHLHLLHSHLQCIRAPISAHLHQHLLFCFVFYYSHSNGCEVASRGLSPLFLYLGLYIQSFLSKDLLWALTVANLYSAAICGLTAMFKGMLKGMVKWPQTQAQVKLGCTGVEV